MISTTLKSRSAQIFKTEDDLQKAISDYYNDKSFSELARELDCSISGIMDALQNAGVISRGQYNTEGKHYNQKYTLNEDVFEKIDTAEKAYWLGFLYADGNVSKSEKVVTLSQSSPREYILSDFQNFLETNYPVNLMSKGKLTTFPNGRKYQTNDAYRILVRSERMKENLISLGCLPEKTFDLTFPTEQQVPKEYQMNFIHGYFDGDGSVVPNKSTLAIRFMGTKKLMDGFKQVLFDIFGKMPKLTEDKRSKGIFYLPYSDVEGMHTLYDLFYNGKTPYIKDKKEVFDKYHLYRKEVLQNRKSKINKRNSRIVKLLEEGLSYREIAKLTNSSRQLISELASLVPSVKEALTKIQKEENQKVLDLHNQGISQREISNRLGISRPKISKIILTK